MERPVKFTRLDVLFCSFSQNLTCTVSFFFREICWAWFWCGECLLTKRVLSAGVHGGEQIYVSAWLKLTLKNILRASLVAQWLRVCLPMQGTRVRALVWEDPTCRGAAGPVSHDCWACASGACAPQQERPRRWEARAPRWRVVPTCHNWRKPSHRNEDPTQPKIN